MRSLLGFALLSAGLWLGAQLYFPYALDREDKLAAVTRILAPAAPSYAATGVSPDARRPLKVNAARFVAVRGTTELESPQSQPQTQTAMIETGALPASPAPTLPQSVLEHPGATTWDAVVTSEPTARRTDSETRTDLTRALQKELRRVGCYDGRIDGQWKAQSRTAMWEFMARVNAALPLTEPDAIMLRLVQAHRADVCGTACPAGQEMQGRRCVASVTVARLAPQPEDARQKPFRTTVIAAVAAPSEPADVETTSRASELPGRMSVGALLPAAARPDTFRTAAIESGTSTTGAPSADSDDAGYAADGEAFPPLTGDSGAKPPARRTTSLAPRAPSARPSPSRVRRLAAPPPPQAAYRRYSRSVHGLFTHPLGRM